MTIILQLGSAISGTAWYYLCTTYYYMSPNAIFIEAPLYFYMLMFAVYSLYYEFGSIFFPKIHGRSRIITAICFNSFYMASSVVLMVFNIFEVSQIISYDPRH